MALFTSKKVDTSKKSGQDTSRAVRAETKTKIKAVQPAAIQIQEKLAMSKPQSYFSIQDYTFKTKGRKGNPDSETTEKALFCEKEIFVVEYKPMATVGIKQKYVRESNLKEIVEVLDNGYPEDISAIVLKEKGYKELIQTLKDNKVSVLDFMNFIKEEVEKFPVKKRGRQAGQGSKGKGSKSNVLVSILAGLAPFLEPLALVEELKKMVNDEQMVNNAVEILEEKKGMYGFDSKGFIKLRLRKAGKNK